MTAMTPEDLARLEAWGRREGASYTPESMVERQTRAITAACTDEEVIEVVRLLRAHLRRHREGAPVLPMMGEE